MEQTQYDVFISYSRKDIEIADRICQALRNHGITFFIDRQGIGGGMEFPLVLAQAIRNSKLFLFLASKNSYSSKFTINEITYAFNKKERNQILPYIIDGSTLPEELEFVFAGINWRTLQQHPIDIVLVSDLLRLLKREVASKELSDETSTNTPPNNNLVNNTTQNNPANERELKRFGKWGRYGYVDKKTDEIVIPARWTDAGAFFGNLARVYNSKYWGFIDKTGKEVIPCKWKEVGLVSEGTISVRDDNDKWGYIDITGKIIIPCQWEKAGSFRDGLATVWDKNYKKYKIDVIGKIIKNIE